MTERLLPCPFCGDKAFASTTLDDTHYVMCRSEDCWAMTGYLPNKAEAIAAWNRRQSPAGVEVPLNDTELANLVERRFPGSVSFANEPDQFHHLIELTPPQLRELLSSLSVKEPEAFASHEPASGDTQALLPSIGETQEPAGVEPSPFGWCADNDKWRDFILLDRADAQKRVDIFGGIVRALYASPAPSTDETQEPAGAEPIGEAGAMPGSNGGFTMAAFEASRVPIGAKLYASPPPAVTITDEMVERACAAHWRDFTTCGPVKRRGYTDNMRTALTAALSSEARDGLEEE